jgi:hypothetical protein
MSTVGLNCMLPEIFSLYFHTETFQQLSCGTNGTGLIRTPVPHIGFEMLSPLLHSVIAHALSNTSHNLLTLPTSNTNCILKQ